MVISPKEDHRQTLHRAQPAQPPSAARSSQQTPHSTCHFPRRQGASLLQVGFKPRHDAWHHDTPMAGRQPAMSSRTWFPTWQPGGSVGATIRREFCGINTLSSATGPWLFHEVPRPTCLQCRVSLHHRLSRTKCLFSSKHAGPGSIPQSGPSMTAHPGRAPTCRSTFT